VKQVPKNTFEPGTTIFNVRNVAAIIIIIIIININIHARLLLMFLEIMKQ